MTSLFYGMDMKGYTWELPVSERYPITILGVGTTGLAVVEHLYQLALRDVRFVVCHADEVQIRASPVPTRLLYDADDTEAKRYLVDELKQVLTASELTIIVTDLSQPLDCHLASTAVSVCVELNEFTVVAIGLPILTDQPLPEQAANTLVQLQHQAHSLLVYEQGHIASEQRVYQLADGVVNLTSLCDGFISQDYADMRRVITRPGRIAVTKGAGSGPNRSKIVLDTVAAQLNEQPFDARLAQRLMLISATGDEEELLVQEHRAIINNMCSFMLYEPTMVKQGLILDNRLYDQLSLSALFWMPVESEAVDLTY